jgi:hypothetical protein
MKKKIIYIIVYIGILAITIGVGVWSIQYILNAEELDKGLIFQALPIYLGIISFFTKYLIDIFKEENDNKKYWFRNYVLESYLKKFNGFIDKTKDLFLESIRIKRSIINNDLSLSLYKDKTAQEYSKIADRYTVLWGECISALDFIKIYDKKLYEKLNIVFEKLQDQFMNRLDEEAASIEIKDIDNYCVKLEEKRNEILELLYKQSIK